MLQSESPEETVTYSSGAGAWFPAWEIEMPPRLKAPARAMIDTALNSWRGFVSVYFPTCAMISATSQFEFLFRTLVLIIETVPTFARDLTIFSQISRKCVCLEGQIRIQFRYRQLTLSL